MKRRLLILFTLLAFLGLLKHENVVHAEDCAACGPNWNTCMGNGYSASCVSQYGGMLDSCIADGAAAFDGWNVDTSGLETCLANSSPTDCCRDQIKIIIMQRCGCNRDPRNPDCKSCFSF